MENEENSSDSDGRESEILSVEGWSDQELSAAVLAYIEMLSLEQANKSYTKKAFNDALREGALKKRTTASVEYRMQNISAVLEELCLPRIKGYRPAKNIGENTKNKIKRILELQKYIALDLYEPVSDNAELERRVASIRKRFELGQPKGNKSPQRSSAVREAFKRDPLVIAWVLQAAGGICESCDSPAPFVKFCGSPYLEVHHIKTLADGGSDTLSNAVAICPNCHRNFHLGAEKEKRKADL